MLYSEFLNGTGAPQNADTYNQYKEIEAIYMDRESMTKVEAYRLWKRRYGEKSNKPRAKELREIKEAIREFKNARKYVDAQAAEIARGYEDSIAEYRAQLKPDGGWSNYWTMKGIERLESTRDREIYNLYESYGNDATIHIIYTDGSECIASGTEIVTGEITPKMQHIAYAHYQDGMNFRDKPCYDNQLMSFLNTAFKDIFKSFQLGITDLLNFPTVIASDEAAG